MGTPPYIGGGIGFPNPLGGGVSYPGQAGGSSASSTSFFNSPLFGGILSGLGGLAQGLLGNAAANTQADAATNAAHESNQLLSSIYQQNRTDQAPFTLAGYGAVGKLQDYFGLNPGRYSGTGSTAGASGSPSFTTPGVSTLPIKEMVDENGNPSVDSQIIPQWALNRMIANNSSPSDTSGVAANGGQSPADFGSMNHDFSLADFSADPGYGFRQDEGQKAIQRSAAARGSVLGGGTLKSLSRYSQGLASDEFNNAFNRFQVNRTNKINPLFSLAGLGQQGVSQVANSGTNLGGQAANINFNGGVDAGAARASGYASTANAINSGINNTLYSLKNLGRG